MDTIIVTGNKKLFLHYCREKEINPRNRNILWASNEACVRGLYLPDFEIIFTGLYDHFSMEKYFRLKSFILERKKQQKFEREWDKTFQGI